MFLCNNSVQGMCLLLLSSQATFLHAVPVDVTISQVASYHQVAGMTPPPPPGPYFSSTTTEKDMAAKPVPGRAVLEKVVPITKAVTATSAPIQMPASMTMIEPTKTLPARPVAKVPMQMFSPDIPWPDDNASALTGQSAAVLKGQKNAPMGGNRSVRPNPRWRSAPPGPYGFVPNYIPRSAASSGNQFGYNNPYDSGRNAYGMQYGGPMPPPGAAYPQMRNPAYLNPGYFNKYPGQSGFNQGINQNNLNQSDTTQGITK